MRVRRVLAGACALAFTATACTPAPDTSVSSAASSSSPAASTPTKIARPTTTAPKPSARHSSTTPQRTPPATASASSSAGVPPVSAMAAAAGLLDIRTIDPDAIIDLRYATTNNFTHVQLYPKDARCLVHESMAPGLKLAADRLRSLGYVIVYWDCYRPHSVQQRMYDVVPDPNWVARPGPLARSHEAARSVDITLAFARPSTACGADRRIQGHCLLEMGTDFDDFTPRAWAFATNDVSQAAQTNRRLLRKGMAAGGITVYDGEWWHFDGPDADVGRPHLGVPVD